MPALSPTMEEGVIASWVKEEGDAITAGDSLCEIETDKATVDFEMVDDGFLAKKIAPAGGPAMPVGTIIAVMVDNESDVAAFANVTPEQLGANPSPSSSPPSSSPAESEPLPKQEPAPAPAPAPSLEAKDTGMAADPSRGRVFASPLAKKTAAEKGVSLADVQGTGPRGRVIAADVEEYVPSSAGVSVTSAAGSGPAVVAAGPGMVVDVGIPQDEAETGLALAQRKREVPHYYLNCTIDVTNLLELRQSLNSKLSEGEEVSVNDFLIRASAIVMQRLPHVNASWHETFIRQYKSTHINVAVRTDRGVLYPVIKEVQSKGLASIAKEAREMSEAVSEGRALDLSPGTFTITNLGAYGVRAVQPIVSPQQSLSLGVGTISQEVTPAAAGGDGSSRFRIKHTMTVSLSCDHRVVDGAVGAEWLQEFKGLLQDPATMLL